MIFYQSVKNLEEKELTTTAVVANAILLLAFVYALSFNYMRDDARNAVAGVICLIILFRCVVSWPDANAQVGTFSLLGFVAILLSHFVLGDASRTYGVAEYLTLTIKAVSGAAVILYYCHSSGRTSPKLLIAGIASITIVAIWSAATNQPILFAGSLRPAVFTGGEDGLHASAYVVGGALFGTVTLWLRRRISLWLALLLGGALVTIIVLYQVRTVWLMVLVFLLATGTIGRGRTIGIVYWLFLISIGAVLLSVFGLASSYFDYSELSSGRTAVYQERLALLTERPALEFLFGTGAGSELLNSDVWWWEAKNSHNDFIDLAIQGGVLGLLLVMAVIYSSVRNLSVGSLPILFAVLCGSFVSNGLLARPLVAILYFAIMLVPNNETD